MNTVHTKELEIEEVGKQIKLLSDYDPKTAADFARLFSRLYEQEMQTGLHRHMLKLYLKDFITDLDTAMAYGS